MKILIVDGDPGNHVASADILTERGNVDQRYASMTLGAKLGHYVMLRVGDTGRGTPRPVLADIFGLFQDGNRIRPGTSLGLVKSHGGLMLAYSNAGKGTTFQICLPAKVIAKGEPHAVKPSVKADDSYLLASA
jgi:signal transduction histidine kinase